MRRNLSRRVELLFPVTDPALVRHLRDVVLEAYLGDNVRARRMRPDGKYERIRPRAGEVAVDAQASLLLAAATSGVEDGGLRD
jgi:polyphosphate kinase